jgi:colanic acid/amylovoran biosynthesis protein
MRGEQRHVRIAITNMTGARNRGSEALVQSLVVGLSGLAPPLSLSVSLHTEDTNYDRDQFSERLDKIVPYSKWPPRQLLRARLEMLAKCYFWLGRSPLNFFFPECVRDLRNIDLILATGGDLFTSDYGYFDKDARVLTTGIPVALLAQTVGPFKPRDLPLFARLSRSIKLCTVRETESLEYLESEFPQLQPILTADVAFVLPSIDKHESEQILERDCRFHIRDRRLMGLSVSASISLTREGASRDEYISKTISFVDEMNKEGWSAVLIPHVQEKVRRNNDLYTCFEVLGRLQRPDENVVVGRPLSASEFKGVIGLCEVLVGSRTHSTIASMSQGIPTVAIAYSRKAWGIMKDYYGAKLAKQLTIDVKDMTVDSLKAAVSAAIANGRTPEQATAMKRLAAKNFELLGDYLLQPRSFERSKHDIVSVPVRHLIS